MLMICAKFQNQILYSVLLHFVFFLLLTEEIKFDAITPELVKSDKSFVKLTKKHQKELEAMRKRQQKERSMVQKNQCSAIEKLVKSKGRYGAVVCGKRYFSKEKKGTTVSKIIFFFKKKIL